MGVVYSAFDHQRRETVALKTLRRFDGSSLRRLKQEFRSLADVNHPNLVALHELVRDEQWFFTMELVDGFRFTDYVNARMHTALAETAEGAPSPGADAPEVWLSSSSNNLVLHTPDGIATPCSADIERLKSCLVQLAAGVSALHDAGKLHRDIKPSNVLVSHEGRVVILDFGLVTELAAQRRATGREAFVAGTAEYMAPEQGAGLPLSPASDWYATGVILYEALTGARPFRGGVREVLIEKQQRDPVPPSALASGVPPQLEALCMALLHRDPRQRPSGDQIVRQLGAERPASEGVSWSFPVYEDLTELFGRAEAMAALMAAYDDVTAGAAATVLIHGSSGMGKSALTRSFIDGLRDTTTAVILASRCHERESVPFKAVDSIVDALVHHLLSLPSAELAAIMPDNLNDLARVFPVLLEVCAIVDAPYVAAAPDPLEVRSRAFDALRQILWALGRMQPIVICIDDLHWGDADSAALLAHLVRSPDAPRILLVACYRSEETAIPALLERLLDDDEPTRAIRPAIAEIEIGPISRADSVELALDTFDRWDPTAVAWAEQIADEAGGNPFFVRELARHATLDQRRHSLSLGAALAARLDQLPPEPKHMLELISIAGQPITQGAVLNAAKLASKGRLAIQQLRSSHLVRSRGAGDGHVIEPYHDRIRAAVIGRLDAEALAARHAVLGAALESTHEGDAETLAIHFAEAGQPAKAALFAEEAADKAARALAFDRAAQLYRRTLELRDLSEAAVQDPRADSDAASLSEALAARAGSVVGERRRLLERLGTALANDGRGAEAAQAFLTGASSDGEPNLELRRRAAEQLLRCGRVDEGLAVLTDVLDEVGLELAASPRRALRSLVTRRAQLRLRGLSFQEKDEADIPAADLTRIDTCWSVAAGLSTVDNVRGADFQTRHLLLALAAGEPYRIARALATEAAYAGNAGGPGRKRSTKLLHAASALANRIGHPHAVGLASAVTGIVAYQEGRFAEALEHCAIAERTFRDGCTGVAWEMGTVQIFGSMAMAHLGQLRALSRRVPGLLAAAHARGDLYAGTNFRLGYPNFAWLVTGNSEGATAVALDALTHWSRRGFNAQHFYGLLALVNADLHAGEGPRAAARVQDAWRDLVRSLFLRVQFLRIEALWLRGRANLAAASKAAGKERKRLLAIADKDARRIGRERMAWSTPIAEMIAAGVLVQRDCRSAAVPLVRAALAGFEAADMSACAAVAAYRLGDLIGGSEGEAHAARFTEFMIEQDVRDPLSFAAMLAPGF